MSFSEAWDALLDWQKKRGLEAVELFALTKKGLKIQKKDRKLETFEPFYEEALAVRVLAQGCLGFSYATGLSPQEVLQAAERAQETASVLEPDLAAALAEPENYPSWQAPKPQELSPEKGLSFLEDIEQAALSFDPRIKRLQEVSLKQGYTHIYLANSLGIQAEAQLPGYSAVVVAVAEQGQEAQMGWEWQASTSLERLLPEELGREAARRAVARLGAKMLTSVRVPILLPPHVATDFLDLVSHSFCGDQVVKGKSALAQKQGQKVFSDQVTILDDGLLPLGLESRPFDDEGVPQQTTTLVQEGVLQGFLFDLFWGKKAGQRSTGNARRGSFKAPPTVETSNFYLKPGEHTPSELRKAAPKVFEVLEVLGMHTADPVSGDFSVGVAGLLHEGQDPQPVAGMALSGNIFELFQRVTLLGNDLRFYGGTGAPSILIGEMDLSGN